MIKKILPFLIGAALMALAFFAGHKLATKAPAVDFTDVLEKQQTVLDTLTALQLQVQGINIHVNSSLDQFKRHLHIKDSLQEARNKRFIEQNDKADDLRQLMKKTNKSLNELQEIGAKMPF